MTDTSQSSKAKADSRIVKTVRNLKVQSSDAKENNISNNSNDKTSGDSSNNTEDKSNDSRKKVTSLKITQGQINPNLSSASLSHPIPVKKRSRISIDGSEHPVQKTNSKIGNNLYQSATSLGGFRKTKSKYVQNLMNEANLKKYKQSCISIVKNDSEVIKLYEECKYEKTNYSFEFFVEKALFENKVFLYKLEMLLSNTEMIFRKNYKEKFFKEEIVKYLNNIIRETNYKNKIENLEKSFNNHFLFINSFDFVK